MGSEEIYFLHSLGFQLNFFIDLSRISNVTVIGKCRTLDLSVFWLFPSVLERNKCEAIFVYIVEVKPCRLCQYVYCRRLVCPEGVCGW